MDKIRSENGTMCQCLMSLYYSVLNRSILQDATALQQCRNTYIKVLSTTCKTMHQYSENVCQNPANWPSNTVMKHKNLVLTYCWDTEDLAQLEPRGTWYRNVHWWKSLFNNSVDVTAYLVWLPWHAPCRWKPEGGHTAVVMETIRIPQHVDPTPGFFQKALTHKDSTGIHACIWINLHTSTLKLTHVNTQTLGKITNFCIHTSSEGPGVSARHNK